MSEYIRPTPIKFLLETEQQAICNEITQIRRQAACAQRELESVLRRMEFKDGYEMQDATRRAHLQMAQLSLYTTLQLLDAKRQEEKEMINARMHNGPPRQCSMCFDNIYWHFGACSNSMINIANQHSICPPCVVDKRLGSTKGCAPCVLHMPREITPAFNLK